MNNYLGGPYFHEGVPIFPVKLRTRGPHFKGSPFSRLSWGPGIPILRGPHFHMTPALIFSPPRLHHVHQRCPILLRPPSQASSLSGPDNPLVTGFPPQLTSNCRLILFTFINCTIIYLPSAFTLALQHFCVNETLKKYIL